MYKRDASHERIAPLQVERGSDRNFGLVFAGFFTILFAAALWRGRPPFVWGGLSVAFVLVSLVMPGVLGPLNRIWHAFGMLLGRVANPFVMGVVFFVVVTPTALLMRLLGRDPLSLKWDQNSPSYWIRRDPPGPSPESMPLQF